jgi:carboxylesterase type B
MPVHAMNYPMYLVIMINTKQSWRVVWDIEKLFYLKEFDKMIEPELTKIDEKISKMMMSCWGNFATTGKPNIENIVWDKWNKVDENYLFITENHEIKKDLIRWFNKEAKKITKI